MSAHPGGLNLPAAIPLLSSQLQCLLLPLPVLLLLCPRVRFFLFLSRPMPISGLPAPRRPVRVPGRPMPPAEFAGGHAMSASRLPETSFQLILSFLAAISLSTAAASPVAVSFTPNPRQT